MARTAWRERRRHSTSGLPLWHVTLTVAGEAVTPPSCAPRSSAGRRSGRSWSRCSYSSRPRRAALLGRGRGRRRRRRAGPAASGATTGPAATCRLAGRRARGRSTATTVHVRGVERPQTPLIAAGVAPLCPDRVRLRTGSTPPVTMRTCACGPARASTPADGSRRARRAREPVAPVRTLTRADKDALLLAIADALVAQTADRSSRPTTRTSRAAAREGLSDGLVDRLRLDTTGSPRSPTALRDLAALPDPVGEVVRGSSAWPTASRCARSGCPWASSAMVYEARPNVTVDAAGLALKSGNAVVLRGGSAAAHSRTRPWSTVLREALAGAGPARRRRHADRRRRARGASSS